jgi:hypothetical protein
MKSQWYKFKDEAIKLRRGGASLRDVEKRLKIPRSTLSYWFKDVVLTARQKEKLLKNWHYALGKARVEAVKWHHKQKELRMAEANRQALETLNTIDLSKKSILDLALAMLYLGEGSKTLPQTSIGSSSPMILKFFIKALELVYGLERRAIKCELHLRADQKPNLIKRYWVRELGIPLKNFTKAAIDLRTKGIATYKYYKGVCVLQCSNAAIQRKLLFLAKEFCEKVINS